MSKLSNVVKAVVALAVVVVIGVLIGWLGSSGRQPGGPPSGAVPETQGTADNPALAARPQPASPRPTEPTTSENPASAAPAPSGLITNWSDKLDEILTSTADEADKGKQLLEMFPRLSEEGQVEVAQHLANLLSDQDYPALGKYLADPKTPEAVLEVLLGDALNRPNGVKLPLLLEVARQPDHPKAGEAKDLLELFLEENYGNDWSKWETKLGEWLKENPD
jgi:hypothetical protein